MSDPYDCRRHGDLERGIEARRTHAPISGRKQIHTRGWHNVQMEKTRIKCGNDIFSITKVEGI
jgi:hypothetical protein